MALTFLALRELPVTDIDQASGNSKDYADGLRQNAGQVRKHNNNIPSQWVGVDADSAQQVLYTQETPFKLAGGKFDDIAKVLKGLHADLDAQQQVVKDITAQVESNQYLRFTDEQNGTVGLAEGVDKDDLTGSGYLSLLNLIKLLNEKGRKAVTDANKADQEADQKIRALGPDGGEKKTGGEIDGSGPSGGDESGTDGGTGSDDKPGAGDKSGTDGRTETDDRSGTDDGRPDEETGETSPPGESESGPGEDDGPGPGEDGQSELPGENTGEYPGEDGSTDPDEWNPDDDYEGGGLADGGSVGGGLGGAGGGSAVGGGLGAAGGGGVFGGVGAAAGGPGGGVVPMGAATAATAGRGGMGGAPMGGMMGGHGGQGDGGNGEHTWLSEDDDPFGTGDAAPPVIGYLPPAPAPPAVEEQRPGAKSGGAVTSFT